MRLYGTRNDMIMELIQPGQTLCEIGVFRCEFANELLKTQPSKLVLIDPWEGIVSSGDVDGNNVVHCNLNEVYTEVEKAVKGNSVIDLRRGYSVAELPQYPDKYFDFIYIDGDHSYSGCKIDLLLALQKIKPGGIIAGHDYEMNFDKAKNNYNFGVKNAVDEFCSEYNFEIIAKGMDGCVSYAIRIP
jgi:hypothetical protein